MKVYAVVSSYCNGFESWEDIVDLYQQEEDANSECTKLVAEITGSYQSYYVKEMEVL